jgi:uncharacterized protein involved in type VI secretion and phage assembly
MNVIIPMDSPTDPLELAHDRRSDDRLHSTIAVLVALTASFMAIANIKNGNVVQNMSVAQSKAVDSWAHYQAKSLKESLAQAAVDQLVLQGSLDDVKPAVRAKLDATLAEYRAKVLRYEKEKDEIRQRAEGHEAEYKRLSTVDDQLDMCEACLSLALALYGITALTRRRRLLYLSTAISLWGAVLGLAAFLGWNVRPAWLAALLA